MLITLEQTLQDQENLPLLCKDRNLHTQELFDGNAFYGNDVIIKKYAKVPIEYPLKATFPHGVGLGTNIWMQELAYPFPIAFTYREETKNFKMTGLKKKNIRKKVFFSASPFLYAVKLLSEQKMTPPVKKTGTLFFPGHSTHHISVNMDFNALAEELESLEDKYKPITICIYWRDFNLGHHLPFQEKGFKIVSAGHMFDPYFLFRFYHLCSMHKYASSNVLGSHLFYSIKAGCLYFHMQSSVECTHSGSKEMLKEMSPPPDHKAEKLTSLFKFPPDFVKKEQMDVVDAYLGTKYIKSPLILRLQLMYAELLYKEHKSIMLKKLKNLVKFLVSSEYRMARQQNKAYQEEFHRLQNTPRYTPVTTKLLGPEIKLVDAASFLFMRKEIFQQQIYKFISSTPQPRIIDCGANIGLSAIYFKQLYPDSRIIAFEPYRKVHDALLFNLHSFGHQDVNVINKAVWNSETTLDFMAEGADGGRLEDLDSKYETYQVSTVRLRDYLDEKVEFLKLDIDGAETVVLEDCADSLKNVSNLFIEYHSFQNTKQTLNTILNIISEYGFRFHIHPSFTSPQPFMHRNTQLGMDNQLNIFCFRDNQAQ